MKIYPALRPLRASVKIRHFAFVILNFAFRLAALLHRLARVIPFVARRNPPPVPPPAGVGVRPTQRLPPPRVSGRQKMFPGFPAVKNRTRHKPASCLPCAYADAGFQS